MKIEFTKMHGCGNDFVIIDAREQSVNLSFDQRVKIADRNFGVGCDQIIVLEPSKKADVFMRIYNTDGSEAQACGNATRCVANLLIGKSKKINIETIERVLLCTPSEEKGVICVHMGKALSYEKVDLGNEYNEFLPQPVSINVGNPHCIFLVNDAEKINLEYWGPKIETHPLFPERTNVEFVSRQRMPDFRARVWERGAGITLACGSGAMAITLALKKAGWIESSFALTMDGGIIGLSIDKNDNIVMVGETELVFQGTIEL